jgi:hypothetical protein
LQLRTVTAGHAPAHAIPVAPCRAAASAAADPLSLAGLGACVDEAREAALSKLGPPPDPASFASLRSRLQRACGALDAGHRRAIGEPLLRALERLGPDGYRRLLEEDPERVGGAALLLDLCQAVLQRGEGYQAKATRAFQEVVGDLWDGFLSAEARGGVKPPEGGTVPPIVRWGTGETGPYTWPVTATASLEAGAGVVSLPAANAGAGLVAWPALAHEVAGHDLVAADRGLSEELGEAVRSGLLAERLPAPVAAYFSERIDEVAADVLGILNMGPAAGVGLLGYFRGLNGAWRGTAALRNVGRAEDPHPADIARAYVAAETIRLLSFSGAGRWADRIAAEADRDLHQPRLGDLAVTPGVLKDAAAAVARAIVRTPLRALEGRALGQVQGWTDADEAIVARLRTALREGGAAPGRYGAGAFAAHAVAAAVYEGASGAASPREAFGEMVTMLDAMASRGAPA